MELSVNADALFIDARDWNDVSPMELSGTHGTHLTMVGVGSDTIAFETKVTFWLTKERVNDQLEKSR